MNIFKRIRAAYRRFNWCVEDLLCDPPGMSSNAALAIAFFSTAIPTLVIGGILNTKDSSWTLWIYVIWFCLMGYIIKRLIAGASREEKKKKTQDKLQWKPENLQRFRGRNNTANNELLDFDRFNLPTIYSAVDRWQYVHSERVWLEKKLTPLGFTFIEFQAEFTGEGKKKRYTNYNYYFKKGRHYFKVTDEKGRFTVSSVYYEGYNPDFEMGEYLPKETEISYTVNTIYTALKGESTCLNI